MRNTTELESQAGLSRVNVDGQLQPLAELKIYEAFDLKYGKDDNVLRFTPTLPSLVGIASVVAPPRGGEI